LFLLSCSATLKYNKGALRAHDLPDGVKEEIGMNIYTVPLSFATPTVRTINQ
jgi:hypothetical protein